MSNDLTDSIPTKSELAPNFTVDVINTSVSVFVVIAIWLIFLQVVYPFLYLSFGFIGLIGSMLLMMILLSYSFSKGSDLLSVLAYQSASWRTGIPYMNPKTKCPYLERKWLTFSCRAEQLSEFDVPAFQKCHNEEMWLQCWPDRVPSILQVFDSYPPKKQQHLGFLLASMKEHARSANLKMIEVINDNTFSMDVRLAAGYALAEMKEENGIRPLIELAGHGENARQ